MIEPITVFLLGNGVDVQFLFISCIDTSTRNTEFGNLNVVDWRIFDMVGQGYLEMNKGESRIICLVEG